MDRLLALALVVAAGCSSPAAVRFVAGNAVLSGVSSDQKFVAVLANPTRLTTGAHVGQLEVVPTSGMLPALLDQTSSGGSYARGNSLWYLGGVTVVSEGSPAVEHIYGGLYFWNDSVGNAIKIGDNVREYYLSQNGATCVFMDWAGMTNAATNTGDLFAVTQSSCGNNQCEKFALASALPLAQASWRISNDGKYVLATLRGAAATDPGKVILLEPMSGGMHVLSMGVDPRSPMMTPTGSAVAWVEGNNELHILDPAMPTAAPTILTTSSPIVDSAMMVDAGTFILKTRQLATGPTALERFTGAGSVTLGLNARPIDHYVSQYVPGVTDKYVFYSTAASVATGARDLWFVDTTLAGAQPVMLASAIDDPISAAVGFSDDGTTIQYFDNFDPTTRRGDEYVVPLSTGTRTLVALGVHNAAFIPGTTRLAYVNAPDASTGAGVLTILPSPTAQTEVQNVGIVNFADTRESPARTWYTVHIGGNSDGVWYMPQPRD